MKGPIELQHFKKCIILFMSGIICSALAYAFYVVNPLKLIVEHQLSMKPGTATFNLWKKPPIDVFLYVYVFNITNPIEFLAGKEKMRVKEVGPYVYQESLENKNVTFHDNGTMSYMPKRKVTFNREKSASDPMKDIVNVPNIPMLGVSSALSDSGFFVNYPFTRLINFLDSKSILNITAHEYLWGYEDPLIRLASGIVPNFIDFQKFGLLDRMYDEGENTIEMVTTKNKNQVDENGRYLSINTYNGLPGLPHWGYDKYEPDNNETNTLCNRIQGATEGVVFPLNMNKDAVFRIWRKAFCRTFPIKYIGETVADNGLAAYKYTFTDDFLDTPETNPDNECYCRKMKKCLKKGLSDLTPCYYNIPAAVSLPHFLNADPSLLEGVDGLKPDPERHETNIMIQPTVGMAMHVNSRMQTNLVMQKTYYNSKITPFNDLTVPLFWSDLYIPKLPDHLVLLVKLASQVAPVAHIIIVCLLAIAGITTLVLSFIGVAWVLNQQQPSLGDDNQRRDSTDDLKIPLGYGQYTAIRILPAIKKITSKTDLFG